jgi:hypothetical protein
VQDTERPNVILRPDQAGDRDKNKKETLHGDLSDYRKWR